MTYSIYNSITGELLIRSIDLPEEDVETLSGDSPEGHFRAGSLAELTEAGIAADQLVFAAAALGGEVK